MSRTSKITALYERLSRMMTLLASQIQLSIKRNTWKIMPVEMGSVTFDILRMMVFGCEFCWG